MQKDLKYENTAFFSMCIEVFKRRQDEAMIFIEKCFEKVTNVDDKNISGCTIRELINERGSQKLKKMLEEKS